MNEKNTDKQSYKEAHQEKLNFLMYKLTNFFKANNSKIIDWGDNYFIFKSYNDLDNAIELYYFYDTKWQEIVKHKMVLDKKGNKMKFVSIDKKKTIKQ